MKLADISRFPDGTIEIRYPNGFKFEGNGDERNNPVSGIIISPDNVKYNIPNFKGECIENIITMIKNGELKRYIIKEKEL